MNSYPAASIARWIFPFCLSVSQAKPSLLSMVDIRPSAMKALRPRLARPQLSSLRVSRISAALSVGPAARKWRMESSGGEGHSIHPSGVRTFQSAPPFSIRNATGSSQSQQA